MIEAAAETFFAIFPSPQNALANRIADFLIRARGWSARRNEVAHGVVWEVAFTDNKKGGALFPARYATSKNRVTHVASDPSKGSQQRPVYVYTSVQIKVFAEAFGELEDDVNSIWMETGAWRAGRMADMRDREEKQKT